MASNNKSSVSGDRTSKKPNGKDVGSSADPIKRDGQPRVSSGVSISAPNPKKPNGEAAIFSASLNNPSRKTGVSSGVSGKIVVSSPTLNAVSSAKVLKKDEDVKVIVAGDDDWLPPLPKVVFDNSKDSGEDSTIKALRWKKMEFISFIKTVVDVMHEVEVSNSPIMNEDAWRAPHI